MFKPIKSPVGEVVGDDSYDKGVEYMTADDAQRWYRRVSPLRFVEYHSPVGGDIYQIHERVESYPFADWLEAQGVRLV